MSEADEKSTVNSIYDGLEPAKKKDLSAVNDFTRSKMREETSMDVVAWRSDLGPWPANLDEIVQLARKRRMESPRTGQVVRGEHLQVGRLYRELEPDVFEDITDKYARREDEPAPTWYKGLGPL